MSFLSVSSLEHLIELGCDRSRNEIRCLRPIPVRDNEPVMLERVTEALSKNDFKCHFCLQALWNILLS